MNPLHSHLGPADCDVVEEIADALHRLGYSVIRNALPPPLSEALFQRVRGLGEEDFTRAGIGRRRAHHHNRIVRRDRIRWLKDSNPAENALLAWMEKLRVGLNQRLFLGLLDHECHFSHYSSGAFYKRHVDAFLGHPSRVVTTIVYLNPGWNTNDGGELLLYRHGEETPFLRTLPLFGTLVAFLSEDFPHEVLTARRDRYSVAGWFRINNTGG